MTARINVNNLVVTASALAGDNSMPRNTKVKTTTPSLIPSEPIVTGMKDIKKAEKITSIKFQIFV